MSIPISRQDVTLRLAEGMREHSPTIENYGIGMNVVRAADYGSRTCSLIGVENLSGYNPTRMLNAMEQTEAGLQGAAEVERRKLSGFGIRPIAVYVVSGYEDRANLDSALQFYMGDVVAYSDDGIWSVSHDKRGIPIWNQIHSFDMPSAYRGLLPRGERRRINREVRTLQAQIG